MVADKLMAYPIEHWSYSAMMTFLRNPYGFKKQYILKIYNFKNSPSAIIGKAGHKALEFYFKGKSANDAVQAGMALINSIRDDEVEWGLTGSREKVIKTFSSAFNGYISEFPLNPGEIVGIEKSITNFVEYNGQELALPLKSISDLIVRQADGLEVIDHKFVTTFTKGEDEKGMFAIQAMFNKLNIEKEYGETVKRVIFNEYKISANKNGDAQLQPYVIEFDKHPEYMDVFINLYNSCTSEISRPDKIYLPNFQDLFDSAGETFLDYKSGVYGIEAPMVVQHKTGDVKFVEKNFISAPVNVVDNQYLTEEEKIRVKLLEFGIPVEMHQTYSGSSIVLYTLKASRGIKMNQFEKHAKDLALALKAKTIRIEAPIMGTDYVGIEVPNKTREVINWTPEIIEPDTLKIPIGVDVYGKTIKKDLDEMPHLLVAGSTGSGKSVMINVIVKTLMAQLTPDKLKLVLIDPKRVELAQYKNDPHLLTAPIYDAVKAKKSLVWLTEEMEVRYQQLEQTGSKNIKEFRNNSADNMPYIVVVIDEFADLILGSDLVNPEKEIVRLTQKARAVGIHVIIGTQRPSVDVITGLIKSNVPTRIAFMTSSRVDSNVIIDHVGAEDLIGKGDMLFVDPHSKGIKRLQGFYIN